MVSLPSGGRLAKPGTGELGVLNEGRVVVVLGAQTARARGESREGKKTAGRKEEGGVREGRGEPAQSTYRTKYSPGTANNWGLSQQISPIIS